MKKIVTLLLVLGSLGLNAQNTQSFTAAANEAEQRLEKALAELDLIQEEINTTRPKLGAKLDDVESEALRLRSEASNVARIKAGFDVEVSQLGNERQSVIDNNNYIQSTLLNEYIRRLELTIDPSEIPQYSDVIRQTLAFLETEEEVDDTTIFKNQLEIVSMSLDRVEDIIGGNTFEGNAIVDGTLKDGQFALLGPVSYFTDGAGTVGITNGMIENKANIYTLKGYGDSISGTISSGSGNLPIDTTDGEALEGITHDITLLQEFALGGFVMFPILGLFILAILIAIFKAIELFRVKAAKAKDIDVILDHLRADNSDAALAHAKSVGGPVGEMLCTAVENASEDREVIEEVLYETIIKTQPKLERLLAFIAVVAATAPLLGLLGTVTGMIKTFKLITIVGTGDARNLSSGISEALITTKWGLIVAIPTLIMHALLNRKAKGVVGSMEQSAVGFINGVVEIRGESKEQA
ncbi:MotA/TolQ/ExbB proton channel family protein [Puniceicoccales bacterium CK1056]|uniref:MotA/TolQ/ExbB proton channel family protein n=1 Tax=Oceanipulchritudo coccoides TaxID=2706888 RepID=A0A6B2LZC2_9BACT|nr:MotA/TolQ/ExbB proton channel family protein [Oceanipulchritudo coccoides]NDV61294.1 MotA/TolQ/ExbB proton channel family protein [Oceanipulchritudo coccoides]